MAATWTCRTWDRAALPICRFASLVRGCLSATRELCGTAVEYPSTTTIRVDLIKGWTLEWPRLEREDFIMAIGSARPLEDATRIAYRELVLWMEAEYGFNRWDAYMMLSQCGKIRLGNFVDPKYTVGAGILKSYLAPATAAKGS
jgi:amidase